MLALTLAAAGADAEFRRYDVLFDCTMHVESGSAAARYALFVPGSTARFRRVAGSQEVPGDEPDLEAYDPERLIRIGSLSVPLVATHWNAAKQIDRIGLDVPPAMDEGIHGTSLASNEYGGRLRIEDIDRASGSARATIVQYASAAQHTAKATYTGTCRFTEGKHALPAFESIKS